jgi:hypothetical protein
MMDDNDSLRGSDLPPVDPTARRAVPVGEPWGKHSVPPTGPLVGSDGVVPPVEPAGDPRTESEFTHPPTPLALQAQTLANEVVALRTAATRLTKRTTRNETSIVIGAVGLTADIILSIIVFILLHYQTVNADQLRAQQQQLTAQQQQADAVRRGALCPVYNLILAGRNNTSRANYPAGPAAYDTFFTAIANGATALHCGTP